VDGNVDPSCRVLVSSMPLVGLPMRIGINADRTQETKRKVNIALAVKMGAVVVI
jgi:putative effector of murein hydrolase LrgA (UPF0299 family)